MNRYILGAALLGALGCSGSRAAAPPGEVPGGRTEASSSSKDNELAAAWKRSCATQASDKIAIEYRDEPGGAAVLFTTEGDAARLRERVTEVARYHNSSEPQMAMQDLYSIPHTAKVSDIEGGVKLSLIANATNDDSTLRKGVQKDVWEMQRDGCAATNEAL